MNKSIKEQIIRSECGADDFDGGCQFYNAELAVDLSEKYHKGIICEVIAFDYDEGQIQIYKDNILVARFAMLVTTKELSLE